MSIDKKNGSLVTRLFGMITTLIRAIGQAILKVATALFNVLVFVITPIWRGVSWGVTAVILIAFISVCVAIMGRSGLFGGATNIDSTRGLLRSHETTVFKFREAQVPQINLIRHFQGKAPVTDIAGNPVRHAKPIVVLELNTMSPDHPSPSDFATLIDEIIYNMNVGIKFRGVVLVLNSPGGSVVEYGAYYAQMLRLREVGLPITVCVDQVAASGGYMIAMTGDEIVAAAFSIVGSVGVVAEMINYNGAMELVRIKDVTITAGDFKRDVTPTGKLTDEKIAHRKAKLVAIHNQFKNEVVRLRKEAGQDVDPAKALQADTWTAQESMDLKLGLVDAIGTSSGVLFSLNQTSDLIYLSFDKKQTWGEWMKTSAAQVGDHLIDKLSRTIDDKLQDRGSMPQVIAQ
jgi:serine protease SohB